LDEALIGAVVERVWRPRGVCGLVVGVSSPERTLMFGFGEAQRGGPVPTGETVFEIASVTKVFTAVALAVLAERGLIVIDEPVRTALPEHVRVPVWEGREVTFRDLATHTSGLPNHPLGTIRRWLLHPSQPYAGISAQDLCRGLGRTRLRSEPGARWRYSNTGMGLLGVALEHRTGKPYETVIRELISAPLGLRHTGIAPAVETELAVGYGRFRRRLRPGSSGALAAATDLRSSVSDLLRFTRLALGQGPTELGRAFGTTLSVRAGVGDGSEQALGWRVWRLRGDEFPGHGGSSAGYRSSISLHPRSGIAIAALSTGNHRNRNWSDRLIPALWDAILTEQPASTPEPS